MSTERALPLTVLPVSTVVLYFGCYGSLSESPVFFQIPLLILISEPTVFVGNLEKQFLASFALGRGLHTTNPLAKFPMHACILTLRSGMPFLYENTYCSLTIGLSLWILYRNHTAEPRCSQKFRHAGILSLPHVLLPTVGVTLLLTYHTSHTLQYFYM